MKADILFFNPPQTIRGGCLKNYALLWLGSYLKRNGVTAMVCYLDGKVEKNVKEALARYSPKFVAVSCKWYTNLYGALSIAKAVRKIDKDIKIIAGGNTATFFDKELLLNSDFDVVIRGDAELPLLNIIRNKSLINCTLKEDGTIKRYELQYIQGQQDIANYMLVEPMDILENARSILRDENFVWTGKGCVYNCFYCGGASAAQKELFGRDGLIYRPIPRVLADVAILSRYSRSLMFDFGCHPLAHNYYLQLFKEMPQRKLRLRFFHWDLPSKGLIDQINKTFTLADIHFDISTLCEELRLALTERKLLKPFFTNKELEDIICYCDKKNIRIILENIAGLPGETDNHVKEHVRLSRYLTRNYPGVFMVRYRPLSIEPGAALYKHSQSFNMCSCRSNFEDFFNLTEYAFNSNIVYPFSRFFEGRKREKDPVHPYGVYENGQDRKNSYFRERYFFQTMRRGFFFGRILSKISKVLTILNRVNFNF